MSEHLLGLLLDDGRLPDYRGLNNFCELRSRRSNLHLAGSNGRYRNGRPRTWARGCFRHSRTIVADASDVLGILWNLLLRGDGDRRLRNLRILRFGND